MAAYLGHRFVVQSPETDFNITSNRHRNTIQAKKQNKTHEMVLMAISFWLIIRHA